MLSDESWTTVTSLNVGNYVAYGGRHATATSHSSGPRWRGRSEGAGDRRAEWWSARRAGPGAAACGVDDLVRRGEARAASLVPHYCELTVTVAWPSTAPPEPFESMICAMFDRLQRNALLIRQNPRNPFGSHGRRGCSVRRRPSSVYRRIQSDRSKLSLKSGKLKEMMKAAGCYQPFVVVRLRSVTSDVRWQSAFETNENGRVAPASCCSSCLKEFQSRGAKPTPYGKIIIYLSQPTGFILSYKFPMSFMYNAIRDGSMVKSVGIKREGTGFDPDRE
ncbi:hypothetical protein EVAR_88487_1 [Eumeta japonica]|uniref:Uncharacterized protein n=1 Tax=Eumeta variegata TaxID=151549 RepID=A0A4C1XVW1_EUMVA|nr:hypothetical protein EVAR_88487_1 [Eumeta japonica]